MTMYYVIVERRIIVARTAEREVATAYAKAYQLRQPKIAYVHTRDEAMRLVGADVVLGFDARVEMMSLLQRHQDVPEEVLNMAMTSIEDEIVELGTLPTAEQSAVDTMPTERGLIEETISALGQVRRNLDQLDTLAIITHDEELARTVVAVRAILDQAAHAVAKARK